MKISVGGVNPLDKSTFLYQELDVNVGADGKPIITSQLRQQIHNLIDQAIDKGGDRFTISTIIE
jgi:hypothetical protein